MGACAKESSTSVSKGEEKLKEDETSHDTIINDERIIDRHDDGLLCTNVTNVTVFQSEQQVSAVHSSYSMAVPGF